jgi:Zn-dependent protease
MFRFRLGSIPVEVQGSHLFTSAMIAWIFLPKNAPPKLAVFLVVAWILVVFISVLVHELGHALASRLFGYQPSITLQGMGGHTHPNAPGPIPWHQDVLLTLAGPLFGLLLGLACWVAYSSMEGASPVVNDLLRLGYRANFFWAAVNMAPALPLDGGRLSSVLAMRLLGRERGFLWAQMLAVVTCASIVVWAVTAKPFQVFIALFFTMYGFQALRAAYGAMKGPEQESAELSPQAQVLQQAQESLAKNQLEDARRLAASVLDSGDVLTPELASRAHHTLGWVALKKGQGRLSLDHFSQVQGKPVETHALAAAFSLIGDEGRALPLWEMAWRDTGDRTVMHEYAGSLIRAGKEAQALKLPQVDPAAAFSCAERVLFIRGAYSEAAAMGERALAHVPSPTIAYDAACAFARAQNVPDAVRLLQRAKELGFKDGAYAASDEDLAPLHGHPGFEAWLTDLRQSAPS